MSCDIKRVSQVICGFKSYCYSNDSGDYFESYLRKAGTTGTIEAIGSANGTQGGGNQGVVATNVTSHTVTNNGNYHVYYRIDPDNLEDPLDPNSEIVQYWGLNGKGKIIDISVDNAEEFLYSMDAKEISYEEFFLESL